MHCQESLSLLHGFKSPHNPLSYTCRLMRQFGTVIGILRCVMNRIGNQFSVRDAVASQLVRDDLPRFTAVIFEQPLEEAFSSLAVASTLQKYINNFPVLIYSPPQIMLYAVNLHEYFINIEGIPIPLVPVLQTSSIPGTKFVTPQPDGFIADDDTSFSQKIFDIPMTEIESMIEPDGVLDDFRWKSVTFVRVSSRNHAVIVTQQPLTCQYPPGC